MLSTLISVGGQNNSRGQMQNHTTKCGSQLMLERCKQMEGLRSMLERQGWVDGIADPSLEGEWQVGEWTMQAAFLENCAGTSGRPLVG